MTKQLESTLFYALINASEISEAIEQLELNLVAYSQLNYPGKPTYLVHSKVKELQDKLLELQLSLEVAMEESITWEMPE